MLICEIPFFNIFEHGFPIRTFVVVGGGAGDSLVRGSLNFMLYGCIISILSVSYLVYNQWLGVKNLLQ
jgi:hypothetical protein